jgi:hypothetical protein
MGAKGPRQMTAKGSIQRADIWDLLRSVLIPAVWA